MTFPWEKPVRPELQEDANGLYPGQQHPLDIPDFIRTFRANREASPQETRLSWVPPWEANSPPRGA